MTSTPTTREAYLAAVNAPGAFQSVEWVSVVKPSAANKARTLTKVTKATIRTGVQYANLGVNSDVETGELPWGQWAEFPYVIEHKGGDYARLYVKDGTVRTTYLVDGVEVVKAEFDKDGDLIGGFDFYLTPSARNPKKSTGGTITVHMSNLVLR